MENIIESLIIIEKKAQKLNEKAKKDLNNLQGLIEEKKKTVIMDIENNKAKVTKTIQDNIDKDIDGEKEIMRNIQNEILAQIKNEYDSHHSEWEDEIYKAIIAE